MNSLPAVDAGGVTAGPDDAGTSDGTQSPLDGGVMDGGGDVPTDDGPVDGSPAGSDASDSREEDPDAAALRLALRRGCSLILHMDEPAWSGARGEVKDDCLHNDGTAVGMRLPTTLGSGRFGRAGYFSVETCVEIPDHPSLTPTTELTMAAWVKPDLDADNSANGIFSKRVDDQVDIQYTMFLFRDDAVYTDISGPISRYHGSTKLNYQMWHHVAVVFNGASTPSLRIYVDGQLDVAQDAGKSIPIPASPLQALHVGCLWLGKGADLYAESYRGLIDEAAIWLRALSDQEIDQLAHLNEPL